MHQIVNKTACLLLKIALALMLGRRELPSYLTLGHSASSEGKAGEVVRYFRTDL